MRSVAAAILTAILTASTMLVCIAPARAELQFCDRTATDALLDEGHFSGHNGLVVTGTYLVKRGTCGVIIPGRLAGRSYFLRILTNGETYGDKRFRLCTVDVAHFTFNGEDKSTFHCSGTIMPSSFHMAGFANKRLYLANFVRIDTNGESKMIVTQDNTYGIHFVLNK